MAVTKTNFINYIRCPRYVALDNIKNKKLDSMVSLEDYLKEEREAQIEEILGSMYDSDGADLIEIKNEQLEVMLPYYNKTELLAGKLAPNYFPGTFKFSGDTLMQESFDFKRNGIRYLCYVDIYNELDDAFNIIEVKATTSKKYLELGQKVDGKVVSIFTEGDDHIYRLLEDSMIDVESVMNVDKYNRAKAKLFDKYSSVGHYVYDLAVQRYIIENDLISNGNGKQISKIKYYLAVLNHEYVFDGTFDGVTPVYNKDANGNDIIRYFDMTSITKELMPQIEHDCEIVEDYIKNANARKCPLGLYCEKKKTTKCKYIPVCWKDIPATNSVFHFLDNHHGFKCGEENYTVYDLANMNLVSMTDVDDKYLQRIKNKIQKECVITDKPYINMERIKAGIEAIKYPIYHFDFETFPCPLPRYRGEKCYTQSVFQFSLHIERTPGVCDKVSDHYGYLAGDSIDHRRELVEAMIEYIDTESGGCILVYNEAFEKSRLKELAQIFPEYSEKLLKMRDMVYDLMFVIKGNSKLYESLGFDKDEVGFNYYNAKMTGSFSIKKILPLFSNLTYKGMEIANGVDALVNYAKFPGMTPLEFEHKYQKLVEYCCQDTWAMVEILRGLRDFVNK